MTVSEQLFEQLCRDRRIRFEPIPKADGKRTADYKIWLGNSETIVEVKQIELSEHENQLIASADTEGAPAVISDIHTRIRNKFDKAKKQLKNLSRGILPTVLVLYDNTNGLSGMDNEDIMHAMHGDEVVEIEVPRDPMSRKPLRTFHTYGKRNRKVGKNYNRSVSALARLYVNKTTGPALILFHNEYSTNSLTSESAKLIASRQFVRPPSEQNRYRQWIEVKEN